MDGSIGKPVRGDLGAPRKPKIIPRSSTIPLPPKVEPELFEGSLGEMEETSREVRDVRNVRRKRRKGRNLGKLGNRG